MNRQSRQDRQEILNGLFRNFILLCVFLSGLCIAIGQVSAQQEYIMGGFNQNEWKIGHKTNNQNQIIVEFVRLDEKIDSWTELLTMQVIRKPRSPEPLDDLVPKMHQDISKRCPKMTWNVINRQFASETEEAGMMYEWAVKDCPPDADQHEIARIVYGRFNIFRLAYVAKTSALAPEKREQWIKELSRSKIIRR